MADHDLAVFGDWHMNSAWAKRMIAEVAGATLGRNWYHVGDFGMWSIQSRSEGRAYLDAVQTALAAVGAHLHGATSCISHTASCSGRHWPYSVSTRS